jgi:uncharacterized protein (TIGR03067 family)
MKWFQITGGVMAGVLVVAYALSVRGGDLDPISVQWPVKTEKTGKLEGRWIVVSGTIDGDEQDLRGAKVNIAKGMFTVTEQSGEVQKATYKVDASKKPSHIDMTPTEGRQKDEVFKGIYLFEGNRLTLCLASPGNDRPTEASSKDGSGQILLVLDPAAAE